MNALKVDVHGILERAGANPDAPEGSQAWALAQVDAAVAELFEAAKAIYPYIATQVLEHCNGNKCREPWCAGCCGEEDAEASVEKANEAYWSLNSALNRIGGEA